MAYSTSRTKVTKDQEIAMPQQPSSVNTNTALSCFLAAYVQEVR